MRELFSMLPCLEIRSLHNVVLLDTCFLIHVFERPSLIKKLESLCKEKTVVLTSFTIEEFLHVEHKVDEHVREGMRRFLKRQPNLFQYSVQTKPGRWQEEREFVMNADSRLLEKVRDPSDGVLMAAAIRLGADVLTRDKHHLYTTQLENFTRQYGITVMNKMQ